MSFFTPSAMHHSVSLTIGRALDQANTFDGQVKRYLHLKKSIRSIAEGVLYSGYGVSLRSYMERVIQQSEGRLAGVKDFAEQYPAVLQSARHGTAKYLAELSRPRLLRSGFRSSDTIIRKKINPLLSQLDKLSLDFVSNVGYKGVPVTQVLKNQEEYRAHIRQRIKLVFEAEVRHQERAGAGFQGFPRQSHHQSGGAHHQRGRTGAGTGERASAQGGAPKPEQPKTRASARSSGIHFAGPQSPKEAYLGDLEELKLAWSSDPNFGQKRIALLESLSDLLKNAAQVNGLTVDKLLVSCSGVQSVRLNRSVVEKKLLSQIHFAVHPDKLEQLSLLTNKSSAELKGLKEKAHKFSLFLNWMKGA